MLMLCPATICSEKVISTLSLNMFYILLYMSFSLCVFRAGDLTLDLPSVVEVLTKQLLHDSMQTRIASLRWIYHLHINTPNKVNH